MTTNVLHFKANMLLQWNNDSPVCQDIVKIHFLKGIRLLVIFACCLNGLVLQPYKHNTGGPAEGLQRPATPGRPADPQPLGGSGVGCKVGLQRAYEGGLF